MGVVRDIVLRVELAEESTLDHLAAIRSTLGVHASHFLVHSAEIVDLAAAEAAEKDAADLAAARDQITVLMSDRDAANSKVANLAAELDAANAEVATLTQQLAAAQQPKEPANVEQVFQQPAGAEHDGAQPVDRGNSATSGGTEGSGGDANGGMAGAAGTNAEAPQSGGDTAQDSSGQQGSVTGNAG